MPFNRREGGPWMAALRTRTRDAGAAASMVHPQLFVNGTMARDPPPQQSPACEEKSPPTQTMSGESCRGEGGPEDAAQEALTVGEIVVEIGAEAIDLGQIGERPVG